MSYTPPKRKATSISDVQNGSAEAKKQRITEYKTSVADASNMEELIDLACDKSSQLSADHTIGASAFRTALQEAYKDDQNDPKIIESFKKSLTGEEKIIIYNFDKITDDRSVALTLQDHGKNLETFRNQAYTYKILEGEEAKIRHALFIETQSDGTLDQNLLRGLLDTANIMRTEDFADKVENTEKMSDVIALTQNHRSRLKADRTLGDAALVAELQKAYSDDTKNPEFLKSFKDLLLSENKTVIYDYNKIDEDRNIAKSLKIVGKNLKTFENKIYTYDAVSDASEGKKGYGENKTFHAILLGKTRDAKLLPDLLAAIPRAARRHELEKNVGEANDIENLLELARNPDSNIAYEDSNPFPSKSEGKNPEIRDCFEKILKSAFESYSGENKLETFRRLVRNDYDYNVVIRNGVNTTNFPSPCRNKYVFCYDLQASHDDDTLEAHGENFAKKIPTIIAKREQSLAKTPSPSQQK